MRHNTLLIKTITNSSFIIHAIKKSYKTYFYTNFHYFFNKNICK